jgi:hypothetical protein
MSSADPRMSVPGLVTRRFSTNSRGRQAAESRRFAFLRGRRALRRQVWIQHRSSRVTAVGIARRRPMSAAVQHGCVLAGLLFVGLMTSWPALGVRPFYLDNVISLTLAERSSPWQFWTHSFVTYQPTYRPFAFTVLWLQGQVDGLNASPYYLFNILLWIACAWAVYAIVYTLIRSKAIGGLVALVVLVDARATTLLWTIEERQMPLAVLAGLLALLLTVRFSGFRRRRLAAAAIGLLLLVSALSLEYGLAFSAAVVLAGLVGERGRCRPLITAAICAPLVYAGIRLGLSGGAFHDYCENQGYFTIERPDGVCLSSLRTAVRVKQHIYNVAASVVGIPFPTVFSYSGVLRPHSVAQIGARAVVFALALYGLKCRPRVTIPLIGLWLATALLSFYIYRSRNQLVGVIGLDVAAGIGLAALWPLLRAWSRWRNYAIVGASALALAWVGFSADTMHTSLDQLRPVGWNDPCIAFAKHPADVSLRIVERLKHNYGLPDPDCRGVVP